MPKPLRLLLRLSTPIGSLMFRMGARVQGRPLLRLGTVGSRTGRLRRTILGWFPDGERTDSWLVVASNGGAATHPGWAHNLAKSPSDVTVDVGEGEIPVEAELLEGPERDSVWDQMVSLSPGYGHYTEKTDRELPIFRLTRSR